MPKEPWVHMKTLCSFCLLLHLSSAIPAASKYGIPLSLPAQKIVTPAPPHPEPDAGPTSLGCLAEVWLFNLLHLCQEVIHLERLRGTGYKWCILVLEEFGHQLSEERWWNEPSKRQGPIGCGILTSNTRKAKHRNYRFGNTRRVLKTKTSRRAEANLIWSGKSTDWNMDEPSLK